MVGRFNIDDRTAAASGTAGRTRGEIPRVVVSDLGDARGNLAGPPGDACNPLAPTYCYES